MLCSHGLQSTCSVSPYKIPSPPPPLPPSFLQKHEFTTTKVSPARGGKLLQPLSSPARGLDPRRGSASRCGHRWAFSCTPASGRLAPGLLLDICLMKPTSTHGGSASQSMQSWECKGEVVKQDRVMLWVCVFWGYIQMWEMHQVMWVLQEKKAEADNTERRLWLHSACI